MDSLIVLAFIVFVYIASASARKKKKAQGQDAKMPLNAAKSTKKTEQLHFAAAFDGMAHSQGEKPQNAARASTMSVAEGGRDHGPGIHLHEVSQAQMDAAQEGEDPCHAGQAPGRSIAEEAKTPPNTQDEERARELLRGVIMSEILTRPCQRQAALHSRIPASNGRRA